jgi:hypothetical protein
MLKEQQERSDMAALAFRAAESARRHSEFIQAREILTALLDALRQGTDPIRDAPVAIAEYKLEVLAAMEESKKRRVERSLRQIALSYYRAARKSRLGSASSRQSVQFDAFRYLALSDARKWRAIEALQMQVSSVSESLRLLQIAERHYRMAVEYASVASVYVISNLHARHQRLLRYSHATVRERLALLEYMRNGDLRAYFEAEAAWRDAVREATEFCAGNEASLFPNRFYCLKDLELEGVFIRAAREFRERRWGKSCELLEQWLLEMPVEFRWSWRDTNVRLRLLATGALDAILSSNDRHDRNLRERIRELMQLALSEPVGRVGRYLAHEVAALAAKGENLASVEAILGALAALFPLDSTVEYYDSPSAINPFDSLSPRIRRGLAASFPTSRMELERCHLSA